MKKYLLMLSVLLPAMAIGQGKIHTPKHMNIQMVYVKGGTFFRGCDDPKYSGPEFADEKPVHRVSITSYNIGKYEITQGQWKLLMGILPESYNGVDYINKDCDDCPVVMVNYEEVLEFIRRLNDKYPGKDYRLPTELEWEFAARGGKYTGNYTYSGSNKLSTVSWYGKRKGATHPIGQKEPNELGIYDMSGNVAEWCTDWYDPDYYKTTLDAMDPKGPMDGEKKVVRGGSFYTEAVECRIYKRGNYKPKTRRWDLGFRLATDN